MLHYAGKVRAIARQLEQLRIDAGVLKGDLAQRMHCSGAKVGRILSGETRHIAYSDLVLMLEILQAPAPAREAIVDLWSDITMHRPTFHEFSDLLRPGEAEYFDALRYVDVARVQAAAIFPVMVRAPEYHEVILTQVELREANTARWARLLPALQEVHNPARQVTIILDEDVFMRWTIPGYHAQLDRLLQAHEEGTALIRVVPFTAGIMNSGGFSILSWNQDQEPDLTSVAWRNNPVDWVREQKRRDVLDLIWHRHLKMATDPQLLPDIVELAHRLDGTQRTVVPA